MLFITDCLNKVRTKTHNTRLNILTDYTNVIKFFEMDLNSKHRTEKLKIKNQKYRNRKKQNSERQKPRFTKRIGRKCRLISTFTEQIMTKRE